MQVRVDDFQHLTIGMKLKTSDMLMITKSCLYTKSKQCMGHSFVKIYTPQNKKLSKLIILCKLFINTLLPLYIRIRQGCTGSYRALGKYIT